MKNLLPFLAAIALAGCGLNATVTEPPVEEIVIEETNVPSGQEQEVVMTACRADTGACAQVGVFTDGATVTMMRDETGWVLMAESSCIDGLCAGTDENGVAWTFQQ